MEESSDLEEFKDDESLNYLNTCWLLWYTSCFFYSNNSKNNAILFLCAKSMKGLPVSFCR